MRVVLIMLLCTAALGSVCFPARAQETRTLPEGFRGPTGLAAHDGEIWFADRYARAIVRLDRDGSVLETRRSPCQEPAGLAASDEFLWVSDTVDATIFTMDREKGTVTTSFPAPCAWPQGLAFDSTYLWVACPRAGELVKTDISDGTAVAKIPAPAKDTTGLGFGMGYLWAADRERDELYMVEPDHGWVVNTLPLGAPYPRGVAVDGDAVRIVDYQDDYIESVVPSKVEFVTRSDPRMETVTFRHRIQNLGPDSLSNVRVFLARPTDAPNQYVATFSATGTHGAARAERDRYGQEYRVLEAEDLPAGQVFEARWEAEVVLHRADWFIDPSRVGPLSEIPDDVAGVYLGDEDKYLIQDPTVQQTVAEVLSGERNPYLILQKIFHFVADTMEYELSGGWNAAPFLLERKTGSCSEYTFLTVALLRAAGIPARYVGSVVVRGEDASVDYVMHRWVEAYLPGVGWIPVDPNKGDALLPADQAQGIGHLDPRFVVTTTSGGNSDILGWVYNSVSSYSYTGVAQVRESTVAEWEPAADSESTPAADEVDDGGACR